MDLLKFNAIIIQVVEVSLNLAQPCPSQSCLFSVISSALSHSTPPAIFLPRLIQDRNYIC